MSSESDWIDNESNNELPLIIVKSIKKKKKINHEKNNILESLIRDLKGKSILQQQKYLQTRRNDNISEIERMIIINSLKYIRNNRYNRRNQIIPYLEKQIVELDPNEKFEELLKEMNDKYGEKNNMNYFSNLDKKHKMRILDDFKNIEMIDNKPMFFKIYESQMPMDVKKLALIKLQQLESDNGSDIKLQTWLNGLLRIPFGKYHNISTNNPIEFLDNATTIMNKAIYGHKIAKTRILEILAKWINNPMSMGNVLGIQGVMGNGKTSLVRDGISKILDRPFFHISLGGMTDGAVFEGHDYTYIGSKWGRIVDILMEAKCMNPIIYFDELDKVSKTAHGMEIYNILMHMTDSSQNIHFQDKYFYGIPIDLSKVLFVFSFNHLNQIDPILLDRMEIIRTKHFSEDDKVVIARDYLIPAIFSDVGINNINIDDKIIRYIIENYTHEGGVRKLRELLMNIVMKVNLRVIRNKIQLPYKVTKQNLKNCLLKKRVSMIERTFIGKNLVGHITGLATNGGIGEIMPIDCKFYPSNEIMSLQITGLPSKMTRQCCEVAKTVVWNILPETIRDKLRDKWKNNGNEGIHIHFYESAIGVDGPSAGAATAVAIISLLTGIPVKGDVILTGEIDSTGEIMPIGGLKEKFRAGYKAGAKLAIYPYKNRINYDLEKKEFKKYVGMEMHSVKDIWELLELALVSQLNWVRF